MTPSQRTCSVVPMTSQLDAFSQRPRVGVLRPFCPKKALTRVRTRRRKKPSVTLATSMTTLWYADTKIVRSVMPHAVALGSRAPGRARSGAAVTFALSVMYAGGADSFVSSRK